MTLDRTVPRPDAAGRTDRASTPPASRRATPAPQGIRVAYVDAEILADELASYGPEVRVVEPDDLRERVVARLRATAARNGVVS